jgi:hypothetical protein
VSRARLLIATATVIAASAIASTTADAVVSYWWTHKEVNNGVRLYMVEFRNYSYAYSTMQTIPSSINYICAGGFKRDGSLKGSSRCFSWSQQHYASVVFDAPNVECQAWGEWRGGGAPNWLYVEGGLV